LGNTSVCDLSNRGEVPMSSISDTAPVDIKLGKKPKKHKKGR
jgi:hypothetical protein